MIVNIKMRLGPPTGARNDGRCKQLAVRWRSGVSRARDCGGDRPQPRRGCPLACAADMLAYWSAEPPGDRRAWRRITCWSSSWKSSPAGEAAT